MFFHPAIGEVRSAPYALRETFRERTFCLAGRDAKWHAEAKQHDFPLSILGLLLAQ